MTFEVDKSYFIGNIWIYTIVQNTGVTITCDVRNINYTASSKIIDCTEDFRRNFYGYSIIELGKLGKILYG